MVSRLERHQVWVYLAAILLGFGVGLGLDDGAGALDLAVRPTLVALLFVTFAQVRFDRLRTAATDVRFLATAVAANFVVVPVVVWGLLPVVGPDPAVRLGVLLVLLAPCTDWFITFTHLARGDTGRAMTLMPLNLVLQLALLPVYLWLIHGEVFDGIISIRSATEAFATLILLPLVGAWGARRLLEQTAGGPSSLEGVGTLAVPLVSVVVFLVAASQVNVVTDSLDLLPRLGAVYVAFAVAALTIGVVGGRLVGLSPGSARTLAFSVGTRNSFVVLPFALAVPEAYGLAVVVVVFQSLVELLAMVAYLRVVPWLLPDQGA